MNEPKICTCVICGKPFETKCVKGALYCSPACYSVAHNNLRKQKRKRGKKIESKLDIILREKAEFEAKTGKIISYGAYIAMRDRI